MNPRKYIGAVSALLLYLFIVSATPPAIAGEAEHLIEILELSDFDGKVAKIPDAIKSHLNALPVNPEISEVKGKGVAALVYAAFAADKMKGLCLEYLLGRGGEARLQSVVAYLKHPLYAKFLAWHGETESMQGRAAMQVYATKLAQKPPSEDRLYLIRQLMKANNSIRGTTTVAAMINVGMDRVTQAAIPGGIVASEEEIDIMLESAYLDLLDPITYYVALSTIYTYRLASDEEMKAYIARLISDSGQWYKNEIDQCLLTAVRGATDLAVADIREKYN